MSNHLRAFPLLQLRDVSKQYTLGNILSPAVQNVTLDIHEGEFAAFAGSSGSGKTTLLNLIGGLDTPTTGDVLLQNLSLSKLSSRELANLRRFKIGFIFQTFNLLPVLSGLENVEYPLLRSGMTSAEIRQRAEACLERVGLKSVLHHRPNQMSGGQRQRVAIARAIVHNPSIILADEPTANLDKKTASEIILLMRDLNREKGVTFVFSTHDPMIMEAAKRLIHISDGKIQKDEKRGD